MGFLILSNILATGCPIMPLPTDTWSDLSGDTLTVGCNEGPEQWSLKCRGNHWIGLMQECVRLEEKEEGAVTDKAGVPNPQSVKEPETTQEDSKYYCTNLVFD